MAEHQRRAVVGLTFDCDNRCLFCAQDGLDPSHTGIATPGDLSALRRDFDEVTFIGGEPTLHEDLASSMQAARSLEFHDIGLQTHGRHLDIGTLRTLITAGLDHVHLSIHGATDRVHDYHTGIDGSFADLTSTLDACEDLRLDVVVTTVVTRSNFRELATLCAWLLRRRVQAWTCTWPRVAGRAADAFDRVVPRFALAAPFMLHALQKARAGGMAVGIEGVPACALGPMASLALRREPLAFASVCEACRARPACAGLDPIYLERFEAEELRPRPMVNAAASSPMEDRMARRFVGVGPLAVRRPPDIGVAPAKARRRLPVMRKPKPGLQEVRGRPEAGTAAELFPGLATGSGNGDEDA